jgi:polyphosphate kinase 2 (PPK2 family)
MLVRSGIILIKYWFSVSDAEQERRFQERMTNPTKRWKISPMDLESRKHWADYSRAKDDMFNAPTTSRPRGSWSTPRTSRPPASTSFAICCRRFRTRISLPRRWTSSR